MVGKSFTNSGLIAPKPRIPDVRAADVIGTGFLVGNRSAQLSVKDG